MKFLRIKKTKNGIECFLFNLRLFRSRLPLRYELKRLFNLQLMERNARAIQKMDDSNNRRILYVTTVLSIGGVETRLASQFAFLKENGITPILLTERNDCPVLKDEINLFLDFSAPNAEELLITLIHDCKAEVVEFQLKSARFIESLDMDKLRMHARVGVCLHGTCKLSSSVQKKLDYFLSTALCRNFDREPIVIKNWISAVFLCTESVNLKSKKALFISRLDEEKFPTLANFVNLCHQYNLTPVIAGGVHQEFLA